MRIRRTQRAELPQPENIGGQSVFAPALPVLYTWSCELSQELAGGSSVWNGLCCALSLGRPSLSRHSCHSMWDSRQAGYRTNTHRKLPLCVWTMTEKEQEELEGGEDGFSGRKSPPEVPSDCASVPLDHSGSAAPVPSQESAWFREDRAVPPGSFLALPYQLSTMHRSCPKAGGCWERRLPGGQELAEAPAVARAAALFQPGAGGNVPFPLTCQWPLPKGCVCLGYLSLRTSQCRARSEEPRTAQRC